MAKTRTLSTAIVIWLVGLCFREKLKIESHKTSLLGVECIEGHCAVVMRSFAEEKKSQQAP